MEVAVSVQKINFFNRRKSELASQVRELLEQQAAGIYLDTDWMMFRVQKVILNKEEESRLDKMKLEEEKVLAKKRAELSRLSMRRKGIESLKEKRYSEFKLSESRKAQKQLDEVYQLSMKARA